MNCWLEKIRFSACLAAATCCLGASIPRKDAVPPYFHDKFEKQQTTARKYLQVYFEGILITGTGGYIERMREALELIERTDGRTWYFVRKHIRRITLTGHVGMDVGGGRFTSSEGEVEGLESIAGKIVHDMWHRELYVTGEAWVGREAETACLKKQNEFLKKLNAGQVDLEKALSSEYWKVDYWSRDW